MLRPRSRSWELLRQFGSWDRAMWLATDDPAYAVDGYALLWEPRMVVTG